MAELLRMEGITKQFGAVYANKDINLSIEEGEIHTLLGEMMQKVRDDIVHWMDITRRRLICNGKTLTVSKFM